MHEHERQISDAGLRPKAARLEPPVATPIWQAAGDGRAEVLDSANLMGLQRAVGNAGVSALLDAEHEPEQADNPVHDVLHSPGSALDAGVRADMESALGQDFSDVRVHTDGAAHESARAVNAQAYTVGSDLVFQQGRFDPASDQGRHMLAHELTHVVQQRSGPVDGTDTGNGVKVSDPADSFEREASATADAVLAGEYTVGPSAAAPGPAEASVQREGVEEEEELQTYVQRHEGAQPDEEHLPG